MPSVQVFEAVDSDFSRLFEITSLAFQHNEPFWDLTYPAHDTPMGHLTGTERFLQKKTSDPTMVYAKAVNTKTGQIWGMARWHVCGSQVPPEKEYLLEGGNPGYEGETWEKYRILSDAFMAERNAAIKAANGRIVVLDVLAVDPAFQVRGLGNELVKWGCRKADELGVEAVGEASREGRRLYEKNGFLWRRDVVVEVEGWEKQESAWMVRPKKR